MSPTKPAPEVSRGNGKTIQDLGLVPWLLCSPSTWLHKPQAMLPHTYREFALFKTAATAAWALSAYACTQRFLLLRYNLAESHTSLLLKG